MTTTRLFSLDILCCSDPNQLAYKPFRSAAVSWDDLSKSPSLKRCKNLVDEYEARDDANEWRNELDSCCDDDDDEDAVVLKKDDGTASTAVSIGSYNTLPSLLDGTEDDDDDDDDDNDNEDEESSVLILESRVLRQRSLSNLDDERPVDECVMTIRPTRSFFG